MNLLPESGVFAPLFFMPSRSWVYGCGQRACCGAAQERLARNALTVAVNCVNLTRKPVADAARFSARPACPSTTFCTNLGNAGMDANTIMRLAGHSSISISAKYVHTSEARLQEAVAMMAASTNKPLQTIPAAIN